MGPNPSTYVQTPLEISTNQCYFSSRNHFYSSFYSVHDEINVVLVQFLFFFILVLVQSSDHFSSSFRSDASNHFSSSFNSSFNSSFSQGCKKTSFFQNQKLFFCFFWFYWVFWFLGFMDFNLKKEKIQYAYIVYCSAFINTKLL